MRALKKLLAFILIAAVLLSFEGCSFGSDIIDSMHKVDISDILDAKLPCVNAEELYEKKKINVPPELLTVYGLPSYYDGTDIYFLRDNVPSMGSGRSAQGGAPRTALIAYYDILKQEPVTLFEEDSQNYIFYNLAGVYNSCIYYFRGEARDNTERVTTQLYRLSLYSKRPEMIMDFEMPHYSCNTSLNSFCTFDRYIFFSDGRTDGSDTAYLIYRYNTQSGQIEEFIKDAKNPVSFKNGIAYFKGSGEELQIHYLDLQDNTDEILEVPVELIQNDMGYSGGGDIFLETLRYDEEDKPIPEFGYIDSESSEGIVAIAALPESGAIYGLTGGRLLIMNIYGSRLIYDSGHRCFAKPNINREYIAGYASGNSLLFFCYDALLKNPVIYIYMPKESADTTAVSSGKENR